MFHSLKRHKDSFHHRIQVNPHQLTHLKKYPVSQLLCQIISTLYSILVIRNRLIQIKINSSKFNLHAKISLDVSKTKLVTWRKFLKRKTNMVCFLVFFNFLAISNSFKNGTLSEHNNFYSFSSPLQLCTVSLIFFSFNFHFHFVDL